MIGFCPRLWGLPMLHITILSNGYFVGSALSACSISPALLTIAPRTAYCMSFTFWLMVSMVMELIVRIWGWVFATRVSKPLVWRTTGGVRRTLELRRRAARNKLDVVVVETGASPRKGVHAGVNRVGADSVTFDSASFLALSTEKRSKTRVGSAPLGIGNLDG